jgi:hypothetical protein
MGITCGLLMAVVPTVAETVTVPLYVPLGKLAAFVEIVMIDGAEPLPGFAKSQLPPELVATETLHPNGPFPVSVTCTVRGEGLLPWAVLNFKDDGLSVMKAPLLTVRNTCTSRVRLAVSATAIVPKKLPGCIPDPFAVIVSVLGVNPLLGDTLSHALLASGVIVVV